MSDLARVNVVNDTSALLAHEVASGLNPHGNDSLNETDVRRKLRRGFGERIQTSRVLVDPARSKFVNRDAKAPQATYGLVGTTTLPEMMAALAASIFFT
jgi:hypothetical protein